MCCVEFVKFSCRFSTNHRCSSSTWNRQLLQTDPVKFDFAGFHKLSRFFPEQWLFDNIVTKINANLKKKSAQFPFPNNYVFDIKINTYRLGFYSSALPYRYFLITHWRFHCTARHITTIKLIPKGVHDKKQSILSSAFLSLKHNDLPTHYPVRSTR